MTNPSESPIVQTRTNTSERHSEDSGLISISDIVGQRERAFSLTVHPPNGGPPYENRGSEIGLKEIQQPESASSQAAQRNTFENSLLYDRNESQSHLGRRGALNQGAQFSGGSVLPSSPALSARSEGEWDCIFPESISCTLELLLRDKRGSDRAPDRKPLHTEGPKSLRWFEKTTYDGKGGEEWLTSTSHRVLNLQRKSLHDATAESYIRYGVCRVIGSTHEACEELEDPYQLEEKAISLICGFIHDYKYERFSLKITWEYATLQIKKVPNEKYAETIRSEISSKMVRNYVTKSYIPRKDLLRIMVPEVIRRIIDEDESLKEIHWTDGQRGAFAREVEQHFSRLQAVCIYQGLPMRFLKHLTEHGFRDINLPDPNFEECHECSDRKCAGYLTKFFLMYYGFFAHKFDPDGIMQTFTEEDVLPIYYQSNKKDSQLGYGAASTVYEVKIDPVHHSLSHDRNCAFALKIFHSRDKTELAFRRERDMMEKLSRFPHDHITPYLATWVQGGVACLLFPRAKYNLRTFMSTTEEPKLTSTFVIWFLKQLKGLAGAVDHFHWISEDRGAAGTSRRADRDQTRLGSDLQQNQKKIGLAGFHHDIKAENILVFEKENTSTESRPAGVFRISDFGAGRFANLALGEISTPAKASKGTLTYKAPDESPSRPFDLWALGCVFLELLIWAVTPEQDGGKGFSDRRGWMSDHKPGPAEPTHPDDAFWLRDAKTGKVNLRASVSQQIEDLICIHCKGKKAFTRVTQITSKLFTIDPLRRPVAKDLLSELEDIYEEASEELEADPHCYIRQHTRKSSDKLSAADAFQSHGTPGTPEPGTSHDKSLKWPSFEDDESESEQEPVPFLKRKGNPPSASHVPPASEWGLNNIGPGQPAVPDPHGAESEDDALRHVKSDNNGEYSHPDNQNIDPKPWQPA